jgi:1-deoxy-D-xylulose 5-phosphate reductoisomerase
LEIGTEEVHIILGAGGGPFREEQISDGR